MLRHFEAIPFVQNGIFGEIAHFHYRKISKNPKIDFFTEGRRDIISAIRLYDFKKMTKTASFEPYMPS